MPATPEFLKNNIRVNPSLDALGALGDLGWYCIGAILWAKDYKLPSQVTALPDVTLNSSGVILLCSASFKWDQDDKSTASMHCSFLSHTSTDLAISGSKGSLHCKDYIIPYQEASAWFDISTGAKFVELHIGWNVNPEKVEVASEMPQEVLMVQELANLAKAIRDSGCDPDRRWFEVSRKTQFVMDAVKKSIDLGCKPVDL